MSKFKCQPLSLNGLYALSRVAVEDERGFLSRLFCLDELRQIGWRGEVAQINHTLTNRKGALRGMHFQLSPYSEYKLITCVRGEVFDVAVDLRLGSPTFLSWEYQVLSYQNLKSILIPPGFAHGFQALSDSAELIYCHSAPYKPSFEAAVNPRDPALSIEWPLEVSDISERDQGHAMLPTDYEGVEV